MEVFRTDNGGKSVTNERMSKLLIEFCKVAPDLVDKVILIRDHKGDLMVEVSTDEYCFELFYHLFSYLWLNQGEYNVSIYFQDVCVIGYHKD